MEVEPHARATEDIRAELEEAVRVFEDLRDDAGLATAWTGLASIEWMPCRYARADRAASRALEHARRGGDDRLVSHALTILSGALMFGPIPPGEGLARLDELAPDASTSRNAELASLMARAVFRGMQGAFDEARTIFDQVAETAETLGLHFMVAAHQEERGDLELRAGRPEAAERAFRVNYEDLDRSRDEGHKSTAAGNLARALCSLGRFDEAEGYARIAREAAAQDDLISQVLGRCAQAKVLAARGDLAQAEALAREAVELFSQAESPNSQGDAWMDLAEVLRVTGKLAEAADAAREALGYYERKGNVPSIASTRAFLEDLTDPA